VPRYYGHIGQQRALAKWYNLGYTSRVKTAISIPDEVFEQAERAAKRLGVSRSELFTRAVKEFLDTRREANITASYDAAFADEDDDIDEVRRKAARDALLGVEWSDE
jgi:Ribbon-helix-helix protein, copG family